jgi:hypothetical protein
MNHTMTTKTWNFRKLLEDEEASCVIEAIKKNDEANDGRT